ncbi:hypothetical protein [Microbacterium sp. G2-8]|uniref:hypothetical protein n=1 Tax=Microbacterium sp. G2-8 TaxID=2842454 RepID=UPI001C8A7C99|nr:hypothetical protein [Microbacterium sp. G2-8]
MTGTRGEGPPPGGVRAPVIVAFCGMGYLALVICGLGVVSLAQDDDVISTPDIGMLSGYIAVGASVAAFALLLWGVVSSERPSFWSTAGIALAAGAVHALALGVAAFAATGDLGSAGAAMSEVLLSWVSPTIVVTAAIAAWAGIALRRTRSGRPRWPWEDPRDQ